MGTLTLGIVVAYSCPIRPCDVVAGLPEWLARLLNLVQLNLCDNGLTSKCEWSCGERRRLVCCVPHVAAGVEGKSSIYGCVAACATQGWCG